MTHPVILAAGLCRRMRPLSNALHKTMIPLHDDWTILRGILESLSNCGFERASIVTGYRAQAVEEYALQHGAGLVIDFIHNPRFESTNNIHSLALAFEQVDVADGVLLIESDLVFEPVVLERLLASPHPDVALLDRYRPGMDGTVVQLAADGHIERVIPSAQQGPDFAFEKHFKTLNLYRFSGDFCTGAFARLLRFYSAEVSDNCFYELVLGMIVAAGQARIYGEVLEDEGWAEVDDPVDLRQARYLVDRPGRRQLLRESWGGYWGLNVLDFAFIRNMYFPTPAVFAELRLQLPELIQNYGSSQAVLDQKMQWFLDFPGMDVATLNGASAAFPILRELWGDRPVLLPSPTFGEWERAFPEAQRYQDDGSGELPDQLPTDSVLVVVNPNNPTGTIHATENIVGLARANPSSVVVVDESFVDFSDEKSALEMDPPPNVVVLKSLSKVLGVPGARLGFLASADTELVGLVRAQLPVWNTNSVAEKILELLLKNRGAIESSLAQTVKDREQLRVRLKSLEIVNRIWPSSADFLLVDLSLSADAASEMADRLIADHGILVKDVSRRWGTGIGRIRIAVRTPADHEVLMQALQEQERYFSD